MYSIARMRRRILVVDDDESVMSFYRRFFDAVHRSEFLAHLTTSPEEALAISKAEPIDAAILDWTMPRMSGLELARAIRADPKTRTVAILMVTVHESNDEICTALAAGADDHLSKPFDDKVFLARLRSLVRRRELTLEEHGTYSLAGLVLDPASNSLTVNGKPVHLTNKELDVLKLFLERPNILHNASFIWDAIWAQERERWRKNLAVTISNLRRKLGKEWRLRLECRRGQGYLLRR